MFQPNQPTIKNKVLTWSRDLTYGITHDTLFPERPLSHDKAIEEAVRKVKEKFNEYSK